MRILLSYTIAAAGVLGMSACSKPPIHPNLKELPDGRQVVDYGDNVIGREAAPPPGVVRYCWEEPLVIREEQRPGLDINRQWYHPSYTAVRQVRSGRWRPCEQAKK